MTALSTAAYNATNLWHMKPRAVQYGDSTFFSYQNWGDQDLHVAEYDSVGDSWSTADMGGDALQADAHASPTLDLRNDDWLLLAIGTFLANSTSKNYLVSYWEDADDIATTWDGIALYGNPGSTRQIMTYPLVNIDTSDNVAMIYSASVSSVRKFSRIASTDGGETWGNDIALVEKLVPANSSPYVQTCMAGDRLYVAWDQYNGSDTLHKNLYLVYSDDPTAPSPTWKSMDGVTRTAPFSSSTDYIVLDSTSYDSIDWDNCYIGAIGATGVDGSSIPHIVFGLEDSGETNRMVHVKWGGSSWTFTDIVETAGVLDYPQYSGPICDADILIESASDIAIVVPVIIAGYSEIIEYKSTDGGTTWDAGTQLSVDVNKHHTLPTYPRNNDPEKCRVLWLTALDGTDAAAHYDAGHDINGYADEGGSIPIMMHHLTKNVNIR